MSHTNEPKVMIFDIQHFCLNDGPGVRTCIFFKGCPLRCKWCHNPESYVSKPQLSHNSMLCTGCLKCTEVCPDGACSNARNQGKWLLKVDSSLCTGCRKCLEVCCYDAIAVIGRLYTVDEVMEQIRMDIPYYESMKTDQEKGGITLTGGEPMQHFEFIDRLLNYTGDIHVAMETFGYANPEHYKSIIQRIDLFLFDYKVTAGDEHKRLCGVDNRLILSNLDLLYNMGADIILRLPLIPDVNDAQEHFEGILEILKKYPGIRRAEIMAYHNLGISKAEKMGMEQPEINKPSTGKDLKDSWLKELKKLGIKNVMIG